MSIITLISTVGLAFSFWFCTEFGAIFPVRVIVNKSKSGKIGIKIKITTIIENSLLSDKTIKSRATIEYVIKKYRRPTTNPKSQNLNLFNGVIILKYNVQLTFEH